MFVNDVFGMADNVESAQYSNDVLEVVDWEKQLEYNETKSCLLVLTKWSPEARSINTWQLFTTDYLLYTLLCLESGLLRQTTFQ